MGVALVGGVSLYQLQKDVWTSHRSIMGTVRDLSMYQSRQMNDHCVQHSEQHMPPVRTINTRKACAQRLTVSYKHCCAILFKYVPPLARNGHSDLGALHADS
jgi:hypothetical protein